MYLLQEIKPLIAAQVSELLGLPYSEKDLVIQRTKPEFEGDYTLVLFGIAKQYKKNPDEFGNELGSTICAKHPTLFSQFNVVKGFLNLSIENNYWIQFLNVSYINPSFGFHALNGKKVMVEYSSPNTNKPLHLGHLRNIFLGWSTAEILKQCGYEVVKSCVVNDRGIHICKSMIAWQLFANGATPESTNQKGDHFVGDYYVKFNEEYKKQVEQLTKEGVATAEAEKEAPIMKATQQMLLDWENGKKEVLDLWSRMNEWVYQGFDATYQKIGADFQKTYYESKTYLLGKEFVEQGLNQGVFYKKDDGSTWINLTDDGLDEKLVLRKDGTSVYITQDLGLADQKFNEYHFDQSIYVIADEQNYHMKVLQLILQKLGKSYAKGIYHLSYGMVELPSGRMKSREGTVVDADDLIEEMVQVAKQKTEELGKVKDFSASELEELYQTLALGALKFYLLRVDPKKKMIFNPQESIDFQGFTGPFVQYTHARICSIIRKAGQPNSKSISVKLEKEERDLLVSLEQFPLVIEQAVEEHNPAVIANYVYGIAKSFNGFYTQHSIMQAPSADTKELRLRLSSLTGQVIKTSLSLLGIQAPARM